MSDASSNAGQAADNVEGTPNQIVATANEGNPIAENQAEIDPTPQTPTLAPGHTTPDEQPEVDPTPPVVDGALPPEHALAPAPMPNPAVDPPALLDDENNEISPLWKGAGGIPGVLIDDEGESN
ncbi:hypothetical protein FRC06_008152 [Ceratobasidium sp. 370]|nr:hypothetical protein FRC06_008152 [Ceratobasidium sp. 370]